MNRLEKDYEKMNMLPDTILKAKMGDATAQSELGKAYYNANSIENNDTLAFDWIRRSAEQGNMEAQFRLGDMFALGSGTEKIFSDSYEWYTRASIQGYKRALIRIHNLYQEDIKMRCRGTLNSFETHSQHGFRELFEWRRNKYEPVLNHAIDYYTDLFKGYQSSDQNDSSVQLNLAFMYQHGYGTKKCIRWAFEYYALASEQGNVDAQYNLGCLYQQHTRKKFNYRNAFKWYTKSAQGGNIAAQRCLAYFYLKGLATDIDYEKAVFWYTKAAETGDCQSQVTLGMLYRKGDYVRKDISMSVRWYTLAARQDSIMAQNCLSQLYQLHMLQGIELEEVILGIVTKDSMNSRLHSKLSMGISKLKKSPEYKQLNKLVKHALIGDGSAMYEIGLRYYNGSDGFPQEKDTGIKWIKHAANREHKDAQFMMANLYEEGDSIEQDYRKSYIWYKTIAKKKDAGAQCQVGIMYKDGIGVRRDSLEASKWFIWSADQENSDAQLHFGYLRLHGLGIRKDKKEAEEWFLKSVHQRNIQACYILGELLFYDRLNPKRTFVLKSSVKFLEYAARKGHADAQLFLGSIYKSGNRVQKNIPKSLELCTKAAVSGNGRAQYLLALMYLNGYNVSRDYVKAYDFFKQANDNGYVKAVNLFQVDIDYFSDITGFSKVISMFTEVTERDIDDLAYNIGSFYDRGVQFRSRVQCFDINYAKAKEWYSTASKKGDSRADYRLGVMYEYGKGVKKNVLTAIDYYKKAAEKENCDAIYRLACMYITGNDISKDLLGAFHLFTKLSTMGYKKASDLLLYCGVDNKCKHMFYSIYIEIDRRPIHKENIISMLEKATDEGYTRLQYQLGVMYECAGDESKAFKWFSLAAHLGITDSFYRLGTMYEEGKGTKQDYTIAADLYQKAAEKNHENACFRLGQLYQYGYGIKLDYLKAYSFYKKAAYMNHQMAIKILNITSEATIQTNGSIQKNVFDFISEEYQESLTMCEYVAEHGDTDIQFKVGFAYENNSLEPHYTGAIKWYSMAARASHKEAMYHLGLLYEKGLGVPQNFDKAIQLYNRAYQLESEDAIHRLGTVYHHGKGVEINPVKAFKYYDLSAKSENPKYLCELGRLYEEGELVRKKPLEALKLYTKAYTQGYDKIKPKLYAMYEDKSYENFFFEKLFRILSIVSSKIFRVDEDYNYSDLVDLKNRLVFMYSFGIGTDKNLEYALRYFLKNDSVKKKIPIISFPFFQYPGIIFIEKIKILKEFGDDEKCINQLNQKELYELGMVFYNGRVESENFNYDSETEVYSLIDNYDLDHSHQNIVIEKDYLTAFNYLKRSADKHYPEALFQLGVMHHYGDGIQKNSTQGDKYFDLVSHNNVNWMKKRAVLYHTRNDKNDFSKAFQYYNHLEKWIKEMEPLNLTPTRIAQSVLASVLVTPPASALAYSQTRIRTHEFIPELPRLGQLVQKPTRAAQFAQFVQFVQTGLGILYEYGDGVQQDYQKSIEYYKKAAENNSAMGYFRLGIMYYYGKGVAIDYYKAFDLFEQSFEGYFYGDNLLYVYDQSSMQTSDDTADSKKKPVYCTKTRGEIVGERYYYLGLMYENGQGVQKDESKAQECFRDALTLGCKRVKIK